MAYLRDFPDCSDTPPQQKNKNKIIIIIFIFFYKWRNMYHETRAEPKMGKETMHQLIWLEIHQISFMHGWFKVIPHIIDYFYLISGFPVILAKTFQVISRFCPGQKSHSPGYMQTIFAPKRRRQRCSKFTGVQNFERIVSI